MALVLSTRNSFIGCFILFRKKDLMVSIKKHKIYKKLNLFLFFPKLQVQKVYNGYEIVTKTLPVFVAKRMRKSVADL